MQQGGEGLEVEKNREKGVIRRGGESLITRQREGLRGDKTRKGGLEEEEGRNLSQDRGRGSEGTKQGYRGVKRGGEQILLVYHKP